MDQLERDLRDEWQDEKTTKEPATVKPSDTWVLDPVPGNPRESPTKSLITLTTCEDLFHSPDRSIALRPPDQPREALTAYRST